MPDDDQGLHFGAFVRGAFVDGELVSVASVFIAENEARLRKFAILPSHQKRGIGTKILTHIIERMRERHLNTLWCDARQTAIPFYARFGFTQDGEVFFKHDVAYVKMTLSLSPQFSTHSGGKS